MILLGIRTIENKFEQYNINFYKINKIDLPTTPKPSKLWIRLVRRRSSGGAEFDARQKISTNGKCGFLENKQKIPIPAETTVIIIMLKVFRKFAAINQK